MKTIHPWPVCPILLLATVGLTLPTNAQVTPDGTLGTVVSAVGNQYTINNGTQVGGNLFHSFSQFSIPTGGAALFNNATTVQTIFARVTGGSASNIDGVIRANGTANLFLLNPAGILFGPNASLNIGGSFVASTGSSVLFADGTQFSATDTTNPPLLTVSLPVGLQMGSNPGSITVQNTGHQITIGFFAPADRSQNPIGLQVGTGQTLALIGGAVNFVGGVVTTNGGGHLEVGSVSNGQVKLSSNAQGVVADYSAVTQFNDIHFGQQALLDASGSGGSIQIQGRNISFTEGSAALLQQFGVQPSGGITIKATGSLNLIGATSNGKLGGFIQIDNLGASPTGDLNLSAAQLLMNDGANIHNWTFTPVPGGKITANVTGDIAINGFAPTNPIVSTSITALTLGSGKAGDLTISTDNLRLSNGGSITVLTVGSGEGGTLAINATNLVEIAGTNPLTTLSSSIIASASSTGNAGSAIINTSELLVRDSGILGSSAVASGAAGNVIVNASKSVEVRGQAAGSVLPARIASTAEILDPLTQATLRLPAIPDANAGSLTINTPSLYVTDGGAITVKADGPGTAGGVRINANSIFLDNQGRITAAAAAGEGGNIFLQGDFLLLRHGSLINATAGGTGNGGNININARFVVAVPRENSDIVANAVLGSGGNIQITTQGIFGLKFRPQLTTESDITASSQFGLSGNVQINPISVDPSSGLVALPAHLADSSQQIATGCAGSQGSSFVATGRGGVPQNPTQKVSDDRIWDDMRDLSAYRQPGRTVAPKIEPPPILLQATTWHRNADNTIELIANQPTAVLPTVATCSGAAPISAASMP